MARALSLGAVPRRTESLRVPSAFSARLTSVSLTTTPNSLNSHCVRSLSRQRTTRSTDEIRPLSTTAASVRRCASLSFDRAPGRLAVQSALPDHGVEAQHPVADNLYPRPRPTPLPLRAATAAVVNHRQRQQTPRLGHRLIKRIQIRTAASLTRAR